MTTHSERRIPQAGGLRVLFEQQLNQLAGLLDEWNSRREQSRDEEETLERAIDSVVTGTDARIRCVARYKKTLRESVHSLLLHIETLAEELPAATPLTQRSFTTDPQVNALFVNADDMRRIFSSSRELRDFFARHGPAGPQQAYALLFARKAEKRVLGTALVGDMVLRDVQQTTINFSDHHILAPSPDEKQARQALKQTIFDSIVAYIRGELSQRAGSPGQRGIMPVPPPSEVNLKNPEVYLAALVAMLEEPRELLQFEHDVLTISKLGIKLTADTTEPANELDLHELTVGQRPRQIVTLVSYPRDAMLTSAELRDDALRSAMLTRR